MTSKKAILFGASGFIGSYLLEGLLNDPDYAQVTVVVRKNLDKSNPKLKVLIGDYNTLPSLRNEIIADDVFIALGTTRKNTPDEKVYYQVDHDYPVLAARIAKENGAKSVFVVTAVGSNANSSVFYVRTKGETERDMIALDMEHTHIFRPSMIMGNRQERRPLEKSFIGLFSLINPLLIGPAKKYRGIQAKDIAKSMLAAAKKTSGKVQVYEWEEMVGLV
ncbi:oxidoreductase [Dyadobacter sp.]|uniref:oxidoreductase n=1 Tax=Dyadobacter sp. TaxID=1914288 RepID=UPI003F71C172